MERRRVDALGHQILKILFVDLDLLVRQRGILDRDLVFDRLPPSDGIARIDLGLGDFEMAFAAMRIDSGLPGIDRSVDCSRIVRRIEVVERRIGAVVDQRKERLVMQPVGI